MEGRRREKKGGKRERKEGKKGGRQACILGSNERGENSLNGIKSESVSSSVVSNSVTPWNVACQAPLSMEFSRPEYWSG